MIRVRYPSGMCVTYNDVNYITRRSNGDTALLDQKDGDLQAIVQASAGAIIGWVEPCRVEQPQSGLTLENALNLLLASGRDLDGWRHREKLARLKRMMGEYNARTGCWKK